MTDLVFLLRVWVLILLAYYFDYALYNYLGAELISNPFVNDEMINISFLNNGMYLLKIQYQNEKGELVSKTLKFIKY